MGGLSLSDDPIGDLFDYRAPVSRPAAEDADTAEPAPLTPYEWLHALFPRHVRQPFGDRHHEFWQWVWAIEPGSRPRPFVGIWPRGGGKSTSAELGAAALGLRGKRRYCLYVRETQEKADDSVQNIGQLLESAAVEQYYPAHAQRKVNKFGSSKGWRRNRLRTAGGFTIDAIGLDAASRGVKLEEYRPDVIIFDDIDGKEDSPEATAKKIRAITHSILPAGELDASTAVIGIQNLIIPNGVFAQLADGRADFLADRIVSGPFPAVRGLQTEVRDGPNGERMAVITAGVATWEGQSLEVCQAQMQTWGVRAFLQEAQHEVKRREGALWNEDMFKRVDKAPPLKRVVVAVDPSGGGDEIGIGAVGLGYDGKAYVLEDRTQPGRLGPANWGNASVDLYDELEGDLIAAEKNFGGDMVEANIRASAGERHIPVKMVNASRGKSQRAEPVATLYTEGKVIHVGTFVELEAEQTGWAPGDPWSPNRLDWLVWAVTELMLEEKRVSPRVHFPGMGEKKTA